MDLTTTKLPPEGTPVKVATEYGPRQGRLMGVIPENPRGATRRKRAAKLALKTPAGSAAIPDYEIKAIERDN